MAPGRKVLEDCGIRFEVEPEHVSTLPTYVEDLRDLLLNFRQIIPTSEGQPQEELDRTCREDNENLKTSLEPSEEIYCENNDTAYLNRWAKARRLRQRSKEIVNRAIEDPWFSLAKEYIFEGTIRQTENQHVLLKDLLAWGSKDIRFTNDPDVRGNLPDKRNHQPKPYVWFGLGLYNESQLKRLRGLERKDKGIDYFTQRKLQRPPKCKASEDEAAAVLISQPVKSIESAAFPWMIVELRPEDENEDECINKAANGCHFSIKLCERLAAPAKMKVLPIIAMTVVGPRAKLFVFYKCENAREEAKYCMACLWAENFEHILNAVHLRRIVDQATFWALRMFKPWVTECLDHWYSEKPKSHLDEGKEYDSDFTASASSGEEADAVTHGESESRKSKNISRSKRSWFRRPDLFHRKKRPLEQLGRPILESRGNISTFSTSSSKKDQQTQTSNLVNRQDRQIQTPAEWDNKDQPTSKPDASIEHAASSSKEDQQTQTSNLVNSEDQQTQTLVERDDEDQPTSDQNNLEAQLPVLQISKIDQGTQTSKDQDITPSKPSPEGSRLDQGTQTLQIQEILLDEINPKTSHILKRTNDAIREPSFPGSITKSQYPLIFQAGVPIRNRRPIRVRLPPPPRPSEVKTSMNKGSSLLGATSANAAEGDGYPGARATSAPPPTSRAVSDNKGDDNKENEEINPPINGEPLFQFTNAKPPRHRRPPRYFVSTLNAGADGGKGEEEGGETFLCPPGAFDFVPSGSPSRPRSMSDIPTVRINRNNSSNSDNEEAWEKWEAGILALDTEAAPVAAAAAEEEQPQPQQPSDPEELIQRLQNIRARTRSASTRSLLLANRAQVLVQRMTMEQIRLLST